MLNICCTLFWHSKDTLLYVGPEEIQIISLEVPIDTDRVLWYASELVYEYYVKPAMRRDQFCLIIRVKYVKRTSTFLQPEAALAVHGA